jgi:hypothetical protein
MLNIDDINERLKAVESLVMGRGRQDALTELSESLDRRFARVDEGFKAVRADIAKLDAKLDQILSKL